MEYIGCRNELERIVSYGNLPEGAGQNAEASIDAEYELSFTRMLPRGQKGGNHRKE